MSNRISSSRLALTALAFGIAGLMTVMPGSAKAEVTYTFAPLATTAPQAMPAPDQTIERKQSGEKLSRSEERRLKLANERATRLNAQNGITPALPPIKKQSEKVAPIPVKKLSHSEQRQAKLKAIKTAKEARRAERQLNR